VSVALAHFFDQDAPDWRASSRARIRIATVLAALIVGGLLSTLSMPDADLTAPPPELLLHLIAPPATQPIDVPVADPIEQDQSIDEVAESDDSVPEQGQIAPAAESVGSPTTAGSSETLPELKPSIDWQALGQQGVIDAVDESERTISVNPGFDDKRASAAEQFRPSEAPVEKPIWENVEKDQLGRTILRHENCFRVLDDPNVGNRYAFETFDRHMVQCTYRKYIGKDLPWVEDVLDIHPNLRRRMEGEQ